MLLLVEKIKNLLREFAFAISVIVISLILSNFFFKVGVVPTGSMENTIPKKSVVLFWKFNNTYQQGDIIVFKFDDILCCKRIIATEGDRIRIDNGIVYVNDDKLDEPYIIPDDCNVAEYTVPNSSYFVMGDNRPSSYDSRYWGPVKVDEIEGEIIYLIIPFKKIA